MLLYMLQSGCHLPGRKRRIHLTWMNDLLITCLNLESNNESKLSVALKRTAMTRELLDERAQLATLDHPPGRTAVGSS
jgi:hypothetical protein